MNLKTLQFNPITEKFSTLQYSIPKDKEQLMYDFYLLTALPIWGLSGSGLNAPARESEEMISITKEYQQKIVNYLKPELLDVVFYAISCEFRHTFAFMDIDTIKNDKYVNFYKKYLNPILNTKFNNIISDPGCRWIMFYISEAFWDTPGRKIAFNLVKRTGIDYKNFINIAKHCFELNIWSDSYGGQTWANICEGWLKLNSAKNYNSQVVWIDHVFDLQHNTDSVLNKSISYAKSGSHEWIADALDTKKHATSLFAISDKASPSLKYFAARLIKAATGETYEQYTKKTSLNSRFK